MALQRDLSSLPKPTTRNATAWAPDAEPRFVQLLAQKWAAADTAAGPKARATEQARFRHSDAGKCARAIAFAALDLAPSNPMDLTGTWATRLGTVIHEAWQEALAERYPDALIEPKVSTVGGQGAGHLDAVIYLGGDQFRPDEPKWTIAFELKSVGGYAWKMAVGDRGAAQGPKHEHIVQAALNGKAVDADEIVLGYLSKEAISVGIAARKGFSELGRFCGEWSMTREEYLPYADAEERRISGILTLLDDGQLPARVIPSPELPKGHEIVDPSKGLWTVTDHETGAMTDTGAAWNCSYCAHQDRCSATPSGRCSVDVLIEIKVAS